MADIKKQPGMIIFAQTDSATGEDIGAAIPELYGAGAKNVQVISAVNKKNRCGCVFVIDCPPGKAESVESVLTEGLNITGWHRIATEHMFVNVRVVEKEAVISAGGGTFPFTLQRKESSAAPEIIRPEHDCCVRLRDELKERESLDVPLQIIRSRITEAFLSPEEHPVIRF
ncbi:MAG: nickel insertion protein [Anaerovoracaceae bacterium]|jgi:uncharacterized protein (DUF111 family)